MLVVMVHPEIDVAVVVPAVPAAGPGHDQARGLLAPAVAPRGLSGPERLHQTPGQGPSGRPFEGLGHARHHGLAGQDVPLAAVAVAGDPARPLEALRPGERGRAPGHVHDPHLARLTFGVAIQQPVQRLLWRHALFEEIEPPDTERHLGKGLGGHRARAAPGPRHNGAGRQELRLHGDACLAGLGIDGDDRERGRTDRTDATHVHLPQGTPGRRTAYGGAQDVPRAPVAVSAASAQSAGAPC